jgi:hypothetical protein
VVAVIYIVAVVIHLMAVELMAPGTPLYSLAVTDTAVMSGQEWADRTFMILSTWVPLIAFGGITAWAIVREYRRQAVTAVRRVSP